MNTDPLHEHGPAGCGEGHAECCSSNLDHHEHGHDSAGHDHHTAPFSAVAASATLHCLTGCAIGEILGLIIGTTLGWSNLQTMGLAIALAFTFGYVLSTFPLVKSGLGVSRAFRVVLAADTLSIATMEIVDNAVIAVIPGAMNAGLVNIIFWPSLVFALAVAFGAAYPLNLYLLKRGKGHALTHEFHQRSGQVTGLRRLIPDLPSSLLLAVIASFVLGGLVVSTAAELGADEHMPTDHSEMSH